MLLCAVLNASVGTALRILIETGLASFYSIAFGEMVLREDVT
jgi:hypothetical protein